MPKAGFALAQRGEKGWQKVLDEAGIAPATSCNSRHISDAKQALCYLSYTPIKTAFS
jgi:hypothetical protein